MGLTRAEVLELDAATEARMRAEGRWREHRRRAPRSEGFIYFVRAENGLIKIGWAKNPKRRFSSLCSGSPVALELLAFRPGSLDDEAARHARFAADRVRGEWFRLSQELGIAVIESPAFLAAPPPAPKTERKGG